MQLAERSDEYLRATPKVHNPDDAGQAQCPASRKIPPWIVTVRLIQVTRARRWAHGGKFTVPEESHPWLTAGLYGNSTPYDGPGPGVPFARIDSPTNRVPQRRSADAFA